MPNFPIVDSHMHLYDPGRLSYPWMKGNAVLEKPYRPADFDRLRGNVAVDTICFMEVDVAQDQQLDEVALIEEYARGDARIKGIVAALPLEQGRRAEPLLEQARRSPLLRGIRRLIQSQPDPEFCLQPDFIAGVRMLAPHDLTFDVCILHHQLPNTLKFIAQVPEVQIVLDHIGKPGIKAGLVEPWKRQIREMAGFDNVVCKISGVTTEADHAAWTREQLRPYVEHVAECFGFDRIMFGGDWPVSELAGSYQRWVETVDWIFAGATESEKRRLWRDNAIATYRLA